jgi:hypothetical protein
MNKEQTKKNNKCKQNILCTSSSTTESRAEKIKICMALIRPLAINRVEP